MYKVGNIKHDDEANCCFCNDSSLPVVRKKRHMPTPALGSRLNAEMLKPNCKGYWMPSANAMQTQDLFRKSRSRCI